MTTQTTTAVKTSARPYCKHCKKRFTAKTAKQIYCTRTCKDKALGASRKVDPMEKAMKCAFFYYLAGECRRAGTLEILRGHTVETLSALHSLYKANMVYNGYGDVNDYELSHIHPVKGHAFIGLLFADNLVSAPKTLNRSHGTKYFGHGASINRATLNTKHAVDKEIEKESDVVARVLAYIGKTTILETIKACKIKPTQRCQLTQWIANHYDESNLEHVAALPSLDMLETLKTKELQSIKSLMIGKEVESYSCASSSVEVVMSRELTRLSEVRPELAAYAYAFEDAIVTQRNSSLFTEHHAQMLFDVLHGKSIAVMADTLEMVIAENTEYRYVSYAEGFTGANYHVDSLQYVTNVHGEAQVNVTSLAAFKASVSAPARATTLFEDFAMMSGVVVPVEMNQYGDAPF
ncbi:hypothetical protein PS914_03220 [Pseudomonas fluorescens]|uniref:hypothetical protein n=1 Tax=Pseudomonas fluorescens TaxID=294 RepID=UPI001240F76F|nr:hypothetical protein [Pseudomonas fluorescens]VVP92030.1 hypothetical protein PS914_03220 [Pseudomonas fluorescens]